MNELIQQARKCAVCMIGADECRRESCKVDSCIDVINSLADALEAAEKENEGLKNILRFNMVQIHGERMTVLDALSNLNNRAEKAEAKCDTYKMALETLHINIDLFEQEE